MNGRQVYTIVGLVIVSGHCCSIIACLDLNISIKVLKTCQINKYYADAVILLNYICNYLYLKSLNFEWFSIWQNHGCGISSFLRIPTQCKWYLFWHSCAQHCIVSSSEGHWHASASQTFPFSSASMYCSLVDIVQLTSPPIPSSAFGS